MSKQPFTPDELRVILKWAEAYVDQQRHAEAKIGIDTMFPKEIDRLEEKLRDASPQVLLGMLNACFLMGFDSMESRHPLQKVWDVLTGPFGTHPEQEAEAREVLSLFLTKAGLIAPPKVDGITA